jgi:putative phage-type endonuclease
MDEREKWLAQRREGIGGTDISAIVGVNPYRKPMDVFMDKLGYADPVEESESMHWGNVLEPVIAEEFTNKTGIELVRGEFMRSIENKLVIGTPDFLNHDMLVGMEAKTAGLRQAKLWGEEQTDIVPIQYLTQVYWYLQLTGFDEWKLAVLIGGQEFRIYTIKRDENVQAGLVDRAMQFWCDHIVTKTPPSLDSSEASEAYLKKLFPAHTTETLAIATPNINDAMWNLHEEKKNLKAAEETVATLENQIKAYIGESAGVAGEKIQATWKASKDSEVIDWKEMSWDIYRCYEEDVEKHGLKPCASYEKYKSQYTTTKAGSRRFLLKEIK